MANRVAADPMVFSSLRIPESMLFEAALIAAAEPDVIVDRSSLLRLWMVWGREAWHEGRRPQVQP